ncbi:MAG: spore germination protein, partial [Peptococcaceae bacterium]|nr:spore germination protein [Peptococcaceae bacterium]
MFKQVLQKVLGASGKNTTANSAKEPKEQRPLVANIAENLKILHQVFDLCGDVVFREFQLNTKPALKACVIHIDAVADDSLSSQHLMQSILLD